MRQHVTCDRLCSVFGQPLAAEVNGFPVEVDLLDLHVGGEPLREAAFALGHAASIVHGSAIVIVVAIGRLSMTAGRWLNRSQARTT